MNPRFQLSAIKAAFDVGAKSADKLRAEPWQKSSHPIQQRPTLCA
jgi:hypothetical protein